MSASASPIAASPAPASAASPPSLRKYDVVRMGPQDCIDRIQQIARVLNRQIPPRVTDEFDCPVHLQPMQNPVIIDCGHTFDESALKEIVDRAGVALQVPTCPSCRKKISHQTPNLSVKKCIDQWQAEERVPTMTRFKKANEVQAARYLVIAQDCDEEEGAKAYSGAFLHTNKSEDYRSVPLFYERLGQREKAALAYLHLASYELREGKAGQAALTLKKAQQINPELKIGPLLAGVSLLDNPSREQIDEALTIAFHQADREDAVCIHKQVLAHDPLQFDVYKRMCPLLRDPAERRYFYLQAADLAMQAGKPELAAYFRKEAEAIPVYPTSITEADWAKPALLLQKLGPYPKELEDFLKAPCPIWGHEGKIARDTHIVVPLIKNITTTVNGAPVTEPRTLAALHKLDKASGGPGCNIWQEILKPETDKAPEVEFEWAVMTKDVLPVSRKKGYDAQKLLVEAKGYEVPGFRDAATCILWANRALGIRLYSNDPWTFTRCKEVVGRYHLVVGGFAPGGSLELFRDMLRIRLRVHDSLFCDDEDTGVGGLRKFRPLGLGPLALASDH